jgi:3-hydroxybutyryl-CoA dehydrogenase
MIERVAVIGAGERGARLAAAAARAGFATTLEDVLPSSLRRASSIIGTGNAARIRYALSVEDAVRDADLVLDGVPDELESKLEIFSLLDRMAPPRAIFATPSETLSIADLASCTYRPERCVVLRSAGMLPAGRVTICYPPQVSTIVLEQVAGFLRRLGAEVLLEADLLSLP